jgi:hypothetical protein
MNLNPKAEQPVTDMQDTAEIENADKGPAIGFPGPWNDKDEENNDDPGQLVIYIRDANSGFVAEVRSYPEYEKELPESRKRSRDIAALIAAAPTMLETLEFALQMLINSYLDDDFTEEEIDMQYDIIKVRTCIDIAKGEPR